MKMISRRNFLKVAGVMAGASALAACGSSKPATSGSAASGSVDAAKVTALTVEIGPNPETLDPALNSAIDGGNYLIHAFECLLRMNKDGAIEPGAAESYEVSEDGLTWTFKVRAGLKWSDGSALTANDFVYSWKRVCDPELAAPYAETVLGMVKGYEDAAAGDLDALAVSAPDDTTLVVELANVCPFFDKLAAFATLSPVQQATIEANGDAWATDPATYVSNGSYTMTEWVPSDHITFAKNQNYWDVASLGDFETITFLLQEDPNASYAAFNGGSCSMIKDVPTEEIPSLTGTDAFHVETILGTYYISMNLSKDSSKAEPALQDAKVRQALSLAIDREYVASTLMQGTYTAAYNLMGPGIKDADGTTDFITKANGGAPYISEDFEANLAEAKQLMSDAGYPDGKGFPTISYSTNDAGYHAVLAEYLQQAWAELGVTLEIDIMEWAAFTPARRSQEYQIARNGWVMDYDDPSNMLDLFYSSNGNNDGKYASDEYDAAMDASRTETDPAAHFEYLHKAEDIVMADMGMIPVANYADFWLQDTKLQNTWHNAYGYWYFMYGTMAQ